MTDLPPNHHAEFRQFSGLFGYIAGLTMIIGRGKDARLVAELGELDSSDTVLDIGCGPGTAVRHAAHQSGRVIGLDPSAPMLRLGRLLTAMRRPRGDIEWLCAGAEQLRLPDASVNVVWSLASVHHWPELEAGVDEVSRVLRPGGMFIALERRSPPGATGNASHGWTADQAEKFATMLTDRGFASGDVANHDLGKREVVTVTGHK